MSNNSGGGSAIGLLGLLLLLGYVIFWIVVAIGIAAYALISFWAITMTLISLIAWNRPLRFFHLGITPYQARGIICFGVAGSILLPAFGLFCAWLFEFSIPLEAWFHLWLGGYAMGAYGFAEEQEFTAQEVQAYRQEQLRLAQSQQVLALEQPRAALPAPARTFDYADWADPADWEPN